MGIPDIYFPAGNMYFDSFEPFLSVCFFPASYRAITFRAVHAVPLFPISILTDDPPTLSRIPVLVLSRIPKRLCRLSPKLNKVIAN